jgi:hypothetical protein
MNIKPQPNSDPNVFDVNGTEAIEQATVETVHGVVEDVPVEAVPAGTTAHFPTHAPRLHAGGQATLNALRPKR